MYAMKPLFTKFHLFALLLLLIIGITAVSCWRRGSAVGKRIERIVLISMDTTRADYLSCYGYRRKTTPNIDELAKEGMLFENVISPVPMTLPAHSSMLTGTVPVYHGVHDNLYYEFGKSNVTIAEILKDKGFSTGYRQQWTELLSRYGEMMEVWFDGSTVVKMDDIIEKYAPNAMVFQSPAATIRWVGNERGYAPYPAWNAVRSDNPIVLAGHSTARHGDPDGDKWLPNEVDTTIRDHYWFWSSENEKHLKSLDLISRQLSTMLLRWKIFARAKGFVNMLSRRLLAIAGRRSPKVPR